MEIIARRIFASHPDYTTINFLVTLLGIAKNPQVNFVYPNDLPEPERQLVISEIEKELEELLDGGIFRDFISKDGGQE